MKDDERLYLLAERTELRRILAGIPEEDVLTRSSFAARLEDVEEQLTRAAGESRASSPVTEGNSATGDRTAPDR
jgi:hypothetical protein